jgi:pyridoxine 5-phosphate synthase
MSISLKSSPLVLGVNIDHVATLREARGVHYPHLLQAAFLAEQGGADAITIHLREDRRHIQDADVFQIKNNINSHLNLEIALTHEMLIIAKKVKPHTICFVPEKREEVTTEGGLDVIQHFKTIQMACRELQQEGIQVSLFIDPSHEQIKAARDTGASCIEIHTGQYANTKNPTCLENEYNTIIKGVEYAQTQHLIVNAGHGLHYQNTAKIARIEGLHELNIGHSIIARALFVGLEAAVREMKMILRHASQ